MPKHDKHGQAMIMHLRHLMNEHIANGHQNSLYLTFLPLTLLGCSKTSPEDFFTSSHIFQASVDTQRDLSMTPTSDLRLIVPHKDVDH
jgi:hypothetical protein